jgi:hypothetical protein
MGEIEATRAAATAAPAREARGSSPETRARGEPRSASASAAPAVPGAVYATREARAGREQACARSAELAAYAHGTLAALPRLAGVNVRPPLPPAPPLARRARSRAQTLSAGARIPRGQLGSVLGPDCCVSRHAPGDARGARRVGDGRGERAEGSDRGAEAEAGPWWERGLFDLQMSRRQGATGEQRPRTSELLRQLLAESQGDAGARERGGADAAHRRSSGGEGERGAPLEVLPQRGAWERGLTPKLDGRARARGAAPQRSLMPQALLAPRGPSARRARSVEPGRACGGGVRPGGCGGVGRSAGGRSATPGLVVEVPALHASLQAPLPAGGGGGARGRWVQAGGAGRAGGKAGRSAAERLFGGQARALQQRSEALFGRGTGGLSGTSVRRQRAQAGASERARAALRRSAGSRGGGLSAPPNTPAPAALAGGHAALALGARAAPGAAAPAASRGSRAAAR